jgi:hypothetical protein
VKPTRSARRHASAAAQRRAQREAQHRRRVEAWLAGRYPKTCDHLGPAGPEGSFQPRMSGGQLLALGVTDEALQRAWEGRCGPQPEGLPRLHQDDDFAASEAGWCRRRAMVDELLALTPGEHRAAARKMH